MQPRTTCLHGRGTRCQLVLSALNKPPCNTAALAWDPRGGNACCESTRKLKPKSRLRSQLIQFRALDRDGTRRGLPGFETNATLRGLSGRVPGLPGHGPRVGRCSAKVAVMSTDKVTSQDSPLDRFIAVIPAGGVGTRLWPLSRAAAPKFLHDLTGSGSTLLRATYDRLEPLAGKRVLVVTGTAHRAAVCRQLPEVQDADLVLESEPKDSGAAIGLAAAILLRAGPGHHHGLLRRGPGDQPGQPVPGRRARGHLHRGRRQDRHHRHQAHPPVHRLRLHPRRRSAQHRRRPQRAGRRRVRGEAQRGRRPAVRGQRRIRLERRHVRGPGVR